MAVLREPEKEERIEAQIQPRDNGGLMNVDSETLESKYRTQGLEGPHTYLSGSRFYVSVNKTP